MHWGAELLGRTHPLIFVAFQMSPSVEDGSSGTRDIGWGVGVAGIGARTCKAATPLVATALVMVLSASGTKNPRLLRLFTPSQGVEGNVVGSGRAARRTCN